MLDSFYVSWVSAASSAAGAGSLSGAAEPYLGSASPGSRRDPAPYFYSHKFAQLSPISLTLCPFFICPKRKMVLIVEIAGHKMKKI